MRGVSRERLVRHGISRLWWAAELTADLDLSQPLSGSEEDPYAYTKWLLGKEDRLVSLLEREIGSDSRLLWVIMNAMQSSTARNQSQSIQKVAKAIRVATATMDTSAIDDDALQELVARQVERFNAQDME